MSGIRLGLVATVLALSSACGSDETRGEHRSVRGADAFVARSSGQVAFAVLSTPWTMLPGGIAGTDTTPETGTITTSWVAFDGATVTLSARLPGKGAVVIAGREYALDDGNVLAIRRKGGATVVRQSIHPKLAEGSLAATLRIALEDHREFLGLDSPPPLAVRIIGSVDYHDAGTFFGFEAKNRQVRPIRGYHLVMLERDASGDFLSPSNLWMSHRRPPGKSLQGGALMKDQFPRSPDAKSATIFITEVEFESGEPARWKP